MVSSLYDGVACDKFDDDWGHIQRRVVVIYGFGAVNDSLENFRLDLKY